MILFSLTIEISWPKNIKYFSENDVGTNCIN